MVCEDRCRKQLDLVRSWLAPDHQECTRRLLCGYMDGFRGARFDKLADGTSPPDVITAGARAPYVGASKLLAAKRIRLIPLEDSYVRRVLNTSRRDIWQVIHCLVRDPQIGEGLLQARAAVPAASHLTVHRTLDIIAWRKQQGHCGLA